MATRSFQLAGLLTDYYAPEYTVEVEGRELDPESKGDVLEVKVTMDLNNMTHFDLSINNWDDSRLSFKYSDFGTFDVGNRVHVKMGYAGNVLSMVQGIITSLSPRFPESGPSTLAVGGEDSMVKLKDRKPRDGEQKKFVNMTDGEIAEVIANRNHLVPKVNKDGIQHDIVVQKNQDDAKFLMERAKRIDFDCYIAIDPDTGKDALYFNSPSDARAKTVRVYVFEFGSGLDNGLNPVHYPSLIHFNPTLSLNKQVGKVTVKGWDPATKSVIRYTAGPDDLPGGGGGGDNGPKTIQTRLSDREDIVVDQPVTSKQEARELARSLLRERAYSYITGNAQVIGLPDLRPGDNVELNGLGKRFSGQYHVTKVEHTLGSSGYTTSFDVRNYEAGGTEGGSNE